MLRRVCIVALIIGAMLFIALPTFAAGPSGTGPGDAIELNGVQIGTLEAGKDKWYKFYDAGTSKKLGVEYHFSPANIDNNLQTSFEVYIYQKQGLDWQLIKVGAGTISSQPIGVKFWCGGDAVARNYYLRVYNYMPSTPVTYAFAFTGDQYMPPWLPIAEAAETMPPAPAPSPSPSPAPITILPAPTVAPAPAPIIAPAVPAAPVYPEGDGKSLGTAWPVGEDNSGVIFDQHTWYKIYHPGGDNPLGMVLNFQPRYLEDMNKNVVVSFNIWTLICPKDNSGIGSGPEWMDGPANYPTCAFKIIGRGTRSGLDVGVNYWRHTAPAGMYFIEVFNNSGQKAGYAMKAIHSISGVKDFPPGLLSVPMP
jgi:hypothetical protein